MHVNIIFEHDDFCVVDKPPGIAVQNEKNQPGILPLVSKQLGIERLWLVHRLDKVTSGILILAKSSRSAAYFGQLFETKAIEKFYLAITDKKPKKKQGTIKGGMSKVRDGKWKLTKQAENFAHSQFFSFSVAPNLRLFLVKPLTGKTHQIRVALKSLGSPILGDTLYKGGSAERTYLHAYGIKFHYHEQNIKIVCPPTHGEHYLCKATTQKLHDLSQPWQLTWPKAN